MDVDDGQTASPRPPGKPPMPTTGWPRPLDKKNKPVKKKAHWWDAYHDEGDDQGRWIKTGNAKTQPPPGYVTDACPKCEAPNKPGPHNFGDMCSERMVDPNARCALCARECPRKAKTAPDENVCKRCKDKATRDANFDAQQPKREAQARKRADEGYDDNAGRTVIPRGRNSDATLPWNDLTPDQPDKTLIQCLEVHLDDADASGADYGSVRGEAAELLRRLKGSNPHSLVDGVEYTAAVRDRVRRIRDARGRTTNKPLSPYGCAEFKDWLTDFEHLAQVSCDACSGPIIDFGVISVLVLLLISYNVLAFLTLHLECFCRALRREKPDNREGAAGSQSTRAMLLEKRLNALSSRNAPLWLFRGVLLVELGICGRDPTYTAYFYRTFMMTGSAPGLRLPFYKCMHAVNVMMLSSRGYSALYHAYADCFFGRMASRRAIFFAPNVKEEDEHTVGHNFLWSGYGSGAELRELVSRVRPGDRAQILVRPRLGEIAVFEWDGSDDGIYLRLWRLRRDESLAPN